MSVFVEIGEREFGGDYAVIEQWKYALVVRLQVV
jgi:hypothetical protein